MPLMQSEHDSINRSGRPRFDVPVPEDGYRWWYVDGISDDGRSGIVVIAFVGSVFSPYYYAARSRGPADPENHVAINVGLYRSNGKLWAMTERSRNALARDADTFGVGPSHVGWQGADLHIDIDERSMPLGRRLKGRIVVRPQSLNERQFVLDDEGRHTWQPVAPLAQIDVDFERPSWHWHGDAYVDTNAGQRPLEQDFRSWHWSRGNRAGYALINYAVTDTAARERSLSLAFDAGGNHEQLSVPPLVDLPDSGWRIRRQAQDGAAPVVERTLEDTPFYARSLLLVDERGESLRIMHESLSLERFRKTWVRTLLPFRMPRVR